MLKKLDLKIRRDIDQSKYISFLIKDDELQENIIEFGKKLKIISQKNLVVNLYTMRNI